ncbi:MAG: tetratricopeptide repeat protein [Desulfobacteraceae bacterium]
MARKKRKKPGSGSGRTLFLAGILVILAVVVGGYYIYNGLFPETVRFNYILITKNGEPLKIFQGETVKLHPSDLCKIREISTNIYFNYDIRLVSTGMDINGLLYEEIALQKMLPDNDSLSRHQISVEVKRQAEVLGNVELIIEPRTDDWVDKAKRSIGSERKIKVLEKALNEGFNDPQIIGMLADEYIAASEWNKAAALLEKNSESPAGEESLLKLLNIYELVKNNKQVIVTLDRLIKIRPDDISFKYKLAEAYENSGKINEAVDEYNNLLELAPKDELPWIYKTLGYLYTKKDWPKNAIKNYLKALELDKEDINLYYNLAELYGRTGNKGEADRYLGMAIARKPDDIESRLKMAEGLIKKKQYKNAETQLKEVLKIKPDSTDAWLLRATIEEKRGNKKKLKEYYKKILSIVPGNKTVIFNLGVLEYETGNPKNAKSYFIKYLKNSPNDIDAREFLFEIHRKEKDDKSAYEQATKIINKNPEKKQYYGFIFDYLSKKEDFKTISKIMKTGLKKNPGDSEITRYLIIASLNTGEEKEAISLIEGYLKTRPDDVPTLMQVASLYEKIGRSKEALGIYEKVYELAPDNEKAQESYLRLRLETLE